MALARAEIQLGRILKKDDMPLPGGGKVNGQQIYTDGLEEWKRLMEELKAQSAQPFMMTDLS
jgi:hypothetical protein